MKKDITISENIKYIGVDDHDIDLFEGQYVVPNGISYNSYIIKDEKIAVMDTVDRRKSEEWLDNLEKELAGKEPDYLVVSHMEPDHSYNIGVLAEKYPNMKIIGNDKIFEFMKQFFEISNLEELNFLLQEEIKSEENEVQGKELIKRRTIDRYTEQTVTVQNEDGTTSQMTVQVYNEEGDEPLTLYTLGNLEVNDELIKNPSLLPLTNEQHEELQEVADRLIHMWEDDFTTLGPNSLVVNNYMGYYKEFVADFANKGYTYEGIAETQAQSVQELENQRQTVVGVSTDEELSNLIKFQQGYNASSRYFTVVSEMVEHLISKLG